MAKTEKKNELAVIGRNEFMRFGEKDAALEAAMAAVGDMGLEFTAADMTRVKVPSGGTTMWLLNHPDGEEEAVKEITGILVFAQQYGVLWPSTEMEEGSQPVLITYDLKVGIHVGPIPDEMIDILERHRLLDEGGKPMKDQQGRDLYDWANLPYNEWGSGKNDRGKRCKEVKHLYILREGDILPVIVNVPPTSLGNFSKFIKGVAMRHRLPYWQAITELKLKKETSAGGEPYASIEFSLVGSLSEDDGAVIRRELTGPIQETVARDAVNEAVTAPSSENEEQQPDEALDAKKEATEAS